MIDGNHTRRKTRGEDARATTTTAAEKDQAPTEAPVAALSSSTTDDPSSESAMPAMGLETEPERSSVHEGAATNNSKDRAREKEARAPAGRDEPSNAEAKRPGQPSRPRPKPQQRLHRRERAKANQQSGRHEGGRDAEDDGDGDLPDMTGKIITVNVNLRDSSDNDGGTLPDFTGKFIVVETSPCDLRRDRGNDSAAASDDPPPPPADIDLDDLIAQERDTLSRGVSCRSEFTNCSRSRSWRTQRSSNAGAGGASVKSSLTTQAAATASRIETLLKYSSQNYRSSQRSLWSHRTGGDSESGTAAKSSVAGGPHPHSSGDVARTTRRTSYQSFTPGDWIDERTDEGSSKASGTAGALRATAVVANAISEGDGVAGCSADDAAELLETSLRSIPSIQESCELLCPNTKDENVASAKPIRPLRSDKIAGGTATFPTKPSNADPSADSSHRSKNSRRSKKSNGSHTAHTRNTAATATDKDPEFVRAQARFKFQRGCHYAEQGDHSKSRERFLTALRYTVMELGPAHPRVAMVHEVLGHVERFRLEEEMRERQRRALDDWEVFLAGGDANACDAAGKGRQKTKQKHHAETSAMHFRTALDILGASEVASGTFSAESVDKMKVVAENRELSSMSISDRTFDHSGMITMEELDQLLFGQAKAVRKITPFNLVEMADLYSALTDDGGDDDESSNPHDDDKERSRAEIIRRITDVLESLVQEYGVPPVGKSFASTAAFLKNLPQF